MSVSENFLKKNIYLQLLIILNYFLYLFQLNKLLSYFVAILIFIFLINVIIDNFEKKLFLTKFTLLIYSILSLGSPLIEWDARSIWLFLAKQIYYSENIYSIIIDPSDVGHNDYPLMMATLSASITKLVSGWNEIFPKFANIIIMTSPIIFLASILQCKLKEKIFIFLIIFVMEKRLIVGEMDMINALYFIINVISLAYLFLSENKRINKYFLIYTFLNLIIYTHLRPESFYIAFIMFFLVVLVNFFKSKKKLIILFFLSISFFPIIYWKYQLLSLGEPNIFSKLFDINLLKNTILDFRLHFKINELLFYSKNSIISLIFLAYLIFKLTKFDYKKKSVKLNVEKILNNQNSIYLIIFSIFYFFIIYFSILLSSASDLMLEEIGRFRYNLPVSLGISYAVILFKYKKINQK
jgi:hypothetical protein